MNEVCDVDVELWGVFGVGWTIDCGFDLGIVLFRFYLISVLWVWLCGFGSCGCVCVGLSIVFNLCIHRVYMWFEYHYCIILYWSVVCQCFRARVFVLDILL